MIGESYYLGVEGGMVDPVIQTCRGCFYNVISYFSAWLKFSKPFKFILCFDILVDSVDENPKVLSLALYHGLVKSSLMYFSFSLFLYSLLGFYNFIFIMIYKEIDLMIIIDPKGKTAH